MHDATAARNEGIAICFQHFPDVEVLLDDGYLGLSHDHRGQAIPPPRKPRPGALPDRIEQWERHRRDCLPDTYRTIANPGSDRTTNT